MRKIAFIWVILFANIYLYAIQSQNYKITGLKLDSISNMQNKISYTFSMTLNLPDVGYTIFTSNIYSLHSGLLSFDRGPAPDVSKSYVYPNPCKLKDGCNAVTFTKLSLSCQIKIFNIAGEEVISINKNSNSEKYGWDLKDRDLKYVPSGVYIYYIKDPSGTVKKGKLIVIR